MFAIPCGQSVRTLWPVGMSARGAYVFAIPNGQSVRRLWPVGMGARGVCLQFQTVNRREAFGL